MNFEEIISHFEIVREQNNKIVAKCPNHDDKKASLCITHDLQNNVTLLHCFAGCETIEILDKVGLSINDLYNNSKSNKNNSGIEKEYKYFDSNGTLLFTKVRYKEKKFLIKRQIKNDIIWGLNKGTYFETFNESNNWTKKNRENARKKEFPKCNIVPYNLPCVIDAIKQGKEIFIVEGEKDVESLKKWNIVATTNFDGASKSIEKTKWKKEYNTYFKNAKIVILNDNDTVGISHANFIANELVSIAEFVKRLELPDLNEKEDISDWICKGNTKEELLQLVNNTKSWASNFINKKDEKSLFEEDNCYCRWIYTKNEKPQKKIISNFIIEPLEKIESEEKNVIKVMIKCQGGKQIERILDIKDAFMSGYYNFKKSLNELLIFNGKDGEVEDIKKIILGKNFLIKKGIKTSGFHLTDNKWIFVSEVECIDQNLNKLHNIALMNNRNRLLDTKLLNYESISGTELILIANKLFDFNEIGKAATVIGFTASMFLKEKLWNLNLKFNHLLIIGESGSGKSRTLEDIIMNIAGMDGHIKTASGLTKFGVEAIASSSNFVPLVIEEFKPYLLKKSQVNLISDLMRNIYGKAEIDKGNRDLSLNNYVYKAPIIIIGEMLNDETAVIERSLKVNFSKLDSKTGTRTENYKYLRESSDLLRKFGRALLNEALQLSIDELKDIYKSLYKSVIQNKIETDRVNESITNCMCGIYLICRVFNKLGVDICSTGHTEEELYESIIKNTKEDLLDNNIKSKSIIDLMLEEFDTMADMGSLIENYHFKIIDNNRLMLNLKRIFYTLEVEEKRNLELTKREFSRQLSRQCYWVSNQSKVKLQIDKSLLKSTKSENCTELNIKKLLENSVEISSFTRC